MTGDLTLSVVVTAAQVLSCVHVFVTPWTAGMLRCVSFMPTLLRGFFLIINIEFCQKKAFSTSIEMIIWLLFFNLLMWYTTLIYLHILKFLASLG